MRLSTKLTGIVALGGAAALAAGLISSGGIGAAFTDEATATANIKVGDFACELSADAADISSGVVTISPNKQVATVEFGTINSSDPATHTAPVTVTNVGTIPLTTAWTVTPSGGLFDVNSSQVVEAFDDTAAAFLGATGAAQTINAGFTWATALGNADLKKSGKVTYEVDCLEAKAAPNGLDLYANGGVHGESATWDGRSVMLDPGPMGAGGAALIRIPAGSTLPGQAPTYQYDEWPSAKGQLRFNIYFTNNKHAFYYPESGNWGIGNSSLTAPTTGTNDWDGLVAAIGTAGLTFQKASVLTDYPPIVHVTCVNWSGTPLFGTTC